MHAYVRTREGGGIHPEQRRRNGALQLVVGHVENLETLGVNSRYGAGEEIVVEADLNHDRRGEGVRDRAGEFVVGEIHLLQGGHAGEGVIGDLAGKLVAVQIQGFE